MKASELRIGNWVDSELRNMQIELVDFADILKYYNANNLDHMKPIPLTEEWLKKFGFEKNNVNIQTTDCKWYKFSFVLDYWNAQKFFIYGYIGGNKTIKHVHQLQNLYFALTGEELTIKEL